MRTHLTSCLVTSLYASVYFKTWETVSRLKILWWLLACKYRVTCGSKEPREPSRPVKVNPKDRYRNRLFLKTRLTPLLGQINSDCRVLTTKLRKVSNIRVAKTVNAINQLPIKRHRVPLYTPTALPHHRKEWLAMEAPLHLHSKGYRDSGFLLLVGWMVVRGTVGANSVRLWVQKKYNKEVPLEPLIMDSKIAAL